jgi:hypothetical protein
VWVKEVQASTGVSVDGRLIGGDQQIEPLFGAAFGQFVANAGRRARDDGEWTCI